MRGAAVAGGATAASARRLRVDGRGLGEVDVEVLAERELVDRYVQPTTVAVEGPCAFKLTDSDTWILVYDMYTSGKYQFATSTDLLNFSVAAKPYSFDFTPRHGTIIPVTASEKAALNAKWNPSELAPVPTAPSAAGFRLRARRLEVESAGTGEIRVRVSSIDGRTARSARMEGGRGELDLSDLAAGTWFVQCRTEGRSENGTIALP